jgi:hypothetical protein
MMVPSPIHPSQDRPNRPIRRPNRPIRRRANRPNRRPIFRSVRQHG